MTRLYGNYQEIQKYTSSIVANSVKCSCSHRVAIPPQMDRVICSWCGHWVYRTKELEEEYKKKDFERKLKKYMKESEEKAKLRKS